METTIHPPCPHCGNHSTPQAGRIYCSVCGYPDSATPPKYAQRAYTKTTEVLLA